ncbi:sec14 cytosolic factor [Pyrrhoderma noxium]|uniref:Sec14 cytosolic factor n=1 Tax=Pyrrhoderma noxium TaxID=2282107 RepID=A0A286UC24_9AGAM|nr:sec14 cytosolic factor [Pyrrhoderma noxium]
MSDPNPERRVVYAVTPSERSSEQEELLSVGTRCTAKGCSQFDFLPFKCSHCNEQYCQGHFLPEVHSCSKWDKNAADRRALECPFCQALIAIPPGEDPNIRIGRHIDDDCLVLGQNKSSNGKKKTPICRRPKCGKRLWQPIECDKCHQQFCATHRYPTEHNCKPEATADTKDLSDRLADLSTHASAKSAAAMAAIRRSVASSGTGTKGTQGPSTVRFKSSSRTASTSGSNTPLSSSVNAVKTVFAPENRPKQITPTSNDNNETAPSLPSTPTTSNILSRARDERKSQIRAMEERDRKGLLSPNEKARLKELKDSLKESNDDCIIM